MSKQDDKSWTSFQAHFIEAKADLRERQQTSLQGGYRTNNLVGIEEAFANFAQETAEDRAEVTSLADANIHLATQVAKQANHISTKYAAMDTMTKLVQQLQGEIKTLKTEQVGQSTKKPDSLSYKKENWRINKYCWTHGVVRRDGEACKYKSGGHKDKATSLNRVGGSTRGIPEGA